MRTLLSSAAALALLLADAVHAGDIHAGYKSPLLTIPFIASPPKIDGAIDDAEWQSALSITALQTTEAKLSTRQATVFMAWDADNLYLAIRSPLRPGEKPVQAVRHTDRDYEQTVFDDSYEIWLNAGTHSPDGEAVFFQYLGNSAGAKYDVMFEPAVGNSRPGWNSGWKPKNRVTPDGKYWEMELAIPRASIYHNEPFADGETLHGLIVRNFKRPWEQNNLGGSGSFSAPDSHCRFVLSKTAPAIHLSDVADVKTDTIGATLSASGHAQSPLEWSFASDSGKVLNGTLSTNDAPAGPGPAADHTGDGYYRIQVKTPDGQPLLDWASCRTFGDRSATTQPANDADDRAELALTFNPVHNFVRVEGDLIGFAARKDITRFTASVIDSSGKTIAEKQLQLDDLSYVNGLLNLPDSPAGKYVTRLIGSGSDGREILRKETPFEKKDLAEFPWWNTTVGRIDRVIAPWTAVKVSGQSIDVWGRQMTVGTAGLPARIASQQMDLLHAPATLEADFGSGPVAAKGDVAKATSAVDYRATFTSVASLGDDMTVASDVTEEFDGLYKIKLTLTPKSAAQVKSLRVVIPIKSELATYFNACGEGIRYGFSYGFLPAGKTGALWDSKQVDGQPLLVGSFVPYVWLGNDKAGLCFMADSDEGWSPDDKTPAIEIRRDDPSHTDLVLNLIGQPTTLDGPRTITFALQATPVKPQRSGWRMDTWSTADSFKDFCRVEPVGGHLIWNALPFTLDPTGSKKMAEERQAGSREYDGFAKDKYHTNAVPYFENNGIDPKLAPASGYFADQWKARVSNSLCYDDSLSNYIVWNLDQWTKQTGIDGWYVDNVRPVACDNIDAGRGYRLPDGRIQPTYQMFATRDFFLRVRAMFQDNGKSGKFVLHMTNHMIMPWIGAADSALDGEDHVTLPSMEKDFIDFWSPTRLRLDDQAPQGTPVTFLQEYQGDWKPADLKRVMRAYTAMTIIHDILPGANPNGQNPEVWRGRERFGIGDDNVTFLPYWQKETGISGVQDSIYVSAWQKPGSLLVAAANAESAATTATLQVDLAKLKLNNAHAIDADTGDAIDMDAHGKIMVAIERHDYRQILITGAGQ